MVQFFFQSLVQWELLVVCSGPSFGQDTVTSLGYRWYVFFVLFQMDKGFSILYIKKFEPATFWDTCLTTIVPDAVDI